MNTMVAIFILGVAMLGDYVIEVASELSAEVMLDTEAGAIAEFSTQPSTDIVDTMPAASVSWPN